MDSSREQTAALPERTTGAESHGISFREAFGAWVKIACLSFGGPAGQIAVMHRILVEEKRWIGEARFLHALNYCMLLPGPEAQQLAIYVGWLLHRVKGGLVAGTLFVLPGALAIMVLSWIYAAFGQVAIVQALFFGLKAAVLAIVIEAVVRVGRRALKNRVMVSIAAIAFFGIFFVGVPFPVIILTAAALGYVAGRAGLNAFVVDGGQSSARGSSEAAVDSMLGEGMPDHARPSVTRAVKVAAVGLPLWLGPVLALWLTLGPDDVFTAIGIFFSKMAVVTFGGAYAVLAYVAQEAVDKYAWLRPGEMLDGLGMAETTPGPLIMVTQFVGFMGAFRDPGRLDPMLAGTFGALLTTWVTFVPCFIWIFLGAPYVEAVRGNRALSAALATITAAVVGVILNLAVWFALHVLFAQVNEVPALGMTLHVPVFDSVNPASLVLTAAAMLAIFRFRVGMMPILLLSALAGVALRLLGWSGGL